MNSLEEGARLLDLAARGRRDYARFADDEFLEHEARVYEQAAAILREPDRLKAVTPVVDVA